MSTKKAKSGKQASLSAHPAFPAVVALWFAALLGLGCLVIPAILFENLFAATGIASVVPATAAPLGATARLTIALVAALAGAGMGIVLARKVAAASGTTKAPRVRKPLSVEDDAQETPKRPISAREELGSDSLDEPVEGDQPFGQKSSAPAMPGRRRALSVTDESERSEYLDAAPLPGGEVTFDEQAFIERQHADDDALDLDGFAAEEEHDHEAESLLETLSLKNKPSFGSVQQAGVAGATEGAHLRPFEVEAEAGFDHGVEEAAPDAAADNAPRPFDMPSEPLPGDAPEFNPTDQAFNTTQYASPQDNLREELSAMNSTNDPAAQAAYNPLAGHAAQPEAGATMAPAPMAPAAWPGAATQAPVPPAYSPQPFQQPAAEARPEAVQPPAPVAGEGTLQDLGMVELVERFARALQSSRASAPAPAQQAMASAPAAMPTAFAPAAAAPAVTPEPAYSPTPAPFAAPAAASMSAPAMPEAAPPSPAPSESAPAAAPMVFRRQAAAQAAAPAEDAFYQPQEQAQPFAAPVNEPQAAPSMSAPAVPQALQPLSFNEPDTESEEEGEPLDLSLPTGFRAPEEQQFQAPEPAPAPAPAAAPAYDDEDEGDSDAYSSLLSMKGRFGQQQSFVRIEDDEPVGVEQPVVVFPGQENRRAEPASDGPSRDPFPASRAPMQTSPAGMRPFDGPSQAPVAGAQPVERANAGETERALREALEKLQRMSGTG